MVSTGSCRYCGGVISVERMKYHAVYCATSCYRKEQHDRYHKNNGRASGINTASVGALHEMLVSADLMKRGFYVFRALSPSCPCDLIVMHGKTVLRVEVTTGYAILSGKIMSPRRMHLALRYLLLWYPSQGKSSILRIWNKP